MEGSKLATFFAIFIMVLIAFSSFEATAALEDIGAPAPTIQNTGVALCVPAVLAAMASLVALFF